MADMGIGADVVDEIFGNTVSGVCEKYKWKYPVGN